MDMMKKGDTILYHFAFRIQEAKVIEVYDDKYIKVKHKGFTGLKDIIRVSQVISVKTRS
jgi:hypothetical protein